MIIKSVIANVKIIIFVALCMIGTLFLQSATAQKLKVVHQLKVYKQQVALDSNQKMIELKSVIPNLVYDIRYATANNFTGKQLYKSGTKTYLRLLPAKALQQVQANLNKQGLGLKIWDAYRPYSTTKKMWNLIKDERYVANPAKGSGHNRGLAVDVTIIDLRSGEALDMGTPYDHFSDTAHQTFRQLPPQILQNRKLLKDVMEAAGFTALQTEWWHYYWPNNLAYDVLNLSFTKLALKK